MSTDQGLNIPAVSSNPTKTDNKEDDAALVDSFFLPGGLFSDEGDGSHENQNNNLRIDPTLHTTSSSVHLPKNPWETGTSNTITAQLTTDTPPRTESLPIQRFRPENKSDYNGITTSNIDRFNFGSQYRNEKAESILERTSIESSKFQQIPDFVFPNTNANQQDIVHNVMTKRTNDSQSVVHPPPGFKDGPTTVTRSIDATDTPGLSQKQQQRAKDKYSNGSFLAATSSGTGYECVLPSGEDRIGAATSSGNHIVSADNYHNTSGLTANRSDQHTKSPPHSLQQKNRSLSSNCKKTFNEAIPELDVPIRSAQSGDKDPSKVTPHYNREERDANDAILFPVSDRSKGTSRKSKDYTAEGDCGDEDAEADVEEEEDMEEKSIPSSIICASISTESNSSSLSTCSEVDNSEFSSHGSGHIHNINDEDIMDEGVGYDTDQAHVSEITGAIGNSLCGSDGISSDEKCKSQAPSVNSERRTLSIPSTSEKFLRGHNNQNSFNYSAEKLVELFRSAVESCVLYVDDSLSAIQRSSSYAKATRRCERFSRQIRRFSRNIHIFANWMTDVREVFWVLLIRLVNAGWKHSRGAIEAATIILSFLSQLMKFGLIEALEEFSGVTSCYIVFYLMPKTCIILMDYINLPHWTPHTVTWLAIFSLCQQVKAGKLHETSNISILSFIRKLLMDTQAVPPNASKDGNAFSSTKTEIRQNLPPRQQNDELFQEDDKQVCFLLLKTIKTILPVLYMVEGFSSKFGTIIGATCTNRLTMAFVLSILRKSIVSSPIAWVSWAVQVLLGAFSRSCVFLDVLILFIGLSSIRLIRFLDQQALGKGVHEKLNKQ